MPSSWRKTLGVSMILGPMLSLVSAVASPPLESDTAAQIAQIAQHYDRWYVYALFITVGAWFFVPSIIGLMAMLAARAPRASLFGGALALVGLLVAIGDGTSELVFWQMGARGADRAQMVALSDRYDNAAGSSLFFTVGGIALLIGLGVLAVALVRTRVAPTWAAAAIPVGAIVNIAGFSMSSNAVIIASNLVFLAGFGWIARLLLAHPAGQASQRTSFDAAHELGA
jgi:hypothetical protein